MTRLRTRRTAIALSAALVLASVGAADAARVRPSPDDSQVLLQNEDAWAKAALVGDADKMASYMTDDYVEMAWVPVAPGAPAHWSTVGKSEWVEEVRSHKTVYTSVELHDLSVHVQGNLAIVTGEYSQKGVSDGKDISGSGIYANTWMKHDGRWLVVHSVFP